MDTHQDKKISKKDAFGGASFSGLISILILKFVENTTDGHWAKIYLTQEVVSFISAYCAFSLTLIFSYINHRIKKSAIRSDTKDKIDYINLMLKNEMSPEMEKDLLAERDKLIKEGVSNYINSAMK